MTGLLGYKKQLLDRIKEDRRKFEPLILEIEDLFRRSDIHYNEEVINVLLTEILISSSVDWFKFPSTVSRMKLNIKNTLKMIKLLDEYKVGIVENIKDIAIRNYEIISNMKSGEIQQRDFINN
ncbi:hypothetical protein B5G50_21935 [Brevibacillus brevis]|uniref:hypothetical protein n=1 Tax=Brevibacillus brevis TaxID=1393 RepID=UPI000B3AEABF|nr:hypothetical protein [Brevibacillus brevis]OUQ86393.1 hypothetical protein B5G50_21935 [Brevibacillus brevis]